MNLEKLNKQLVTLCAVALLFLGSLYYLVAVAFDNQETLTHRRDARINLDDYFEPEQKDSEKN